MTLRWTNGAKRFEPNPRPGARSGAAGGARAAICDASHACGLAQKPANLLMTMAFFPTSLPARASRRARRPVAVATQRLRPRLLPIAHTAAAAVLARYLALAVVPDPRPSFASIAAVISVGATYGHRGRRAAGLVGGGVLCPSVGRIVRRRPRRRSAPDGPDGARRDVDRGRARRGRAARHRGGRLGAAAARVGGHDRGRD